MCTAACIPGMSTLACIKKINKILHKPFYTILSIDFLKGLSVNSLA